MQRSQIVNETAQIWLTGQCQMIPGVQRALLMLAQDGGSGIEPAAFWPNDADGMDILVSTGNRALAQKKPVIEPETNKHDDNRSRRAIVAWPLFQRQWLVGVITFEVKANEEELQTIVQLLKWGTAWLQLRSESSSVQTIPARLSKVIEVTAIALEPNSLRATAAGITTHLAQLFSCARVSLGLLDGQHMKVYALSNSAQIDPRVERVRRIESAMDEALAERVSLTSPPTDSSTVHSMPAHERLRADQDTASVCTILLNNAGQPSGALTFERLRGPAIDAATTEVLDAVGAVVGPVLELKRLHDRPFWAKVRDSGAVLFGRLLGPSHLKGKLAFIGLAVLLGWLVLSTTIHRVAATATLEGTEQRVLVAPIDGYIEKAFGRAGEAVERGELIATLDRRDLEIDRRRLASQREDLSKRHGRAIGGMERAEAAIIEAQLGRVNAQLDLLDEQLARMQITAPFDGLIVSGDLSHSLGSPVERGQILFEMTPLDSYRMILQVHESEIGYVKKGQHGYLTLSAKPGDRLPFVVDEIIGISETEDGENGFRVEAHLDTATEDLRPGMRGVGKIEIAERTRLWVWGHRLYERLSLVLWSYLP